MDLGATMAHDRLFMQAAADDRRCARERRPAFGLEPGQREAPDSKFGRGAVGPDEPQAPAAMDMAEYDRIQAVNVRGTLLVNRVFSTAMAEAGKGAIINLCSLTSFRPSGQVAGRQFAAGDQVENGARRNEKKACRVRSGVQGFVG